MQKNYLRYLNILIPMIILLGYFVTYSALRKPIEKDASMQFEVAPSSATISINGSTIGQGYTDLYSGDYDIKIAKNGFKTINKTVHLNPGDKAYEGVVLVSDTENTRDWYTDNPGDAKKSEAISSHLYDRTTTASNDVNNLLAILPQALSDGHGGLINIEQGASPYSKTSTPAIIVTAAKPDDRQAALEWIRTKDYKLSQMDVVFGNQVTKYTSSGE